MLVIPSPGVGAVLAYQSCGLYKVIDEALKLHFSFPDVVQLFPVLRALHPDVCSVPLLMLRQPKCRPGT